MLCQKISYSSSDGKGGEEEIFSDRDRVVISIMGIDDDGRHWSAANSVTVDEFMAGEYSYLDNLIGQTYYYGKQYDDEEVQS